MAKKIVYHGSPFVVQHPAFNAGKPYDDYGRGFYCTEEPELAKEWACGAGTDGFANIYEIDTDGMRVMDLSGGDYNVLQWLAVLLRHRHVRLSSPIARKARDYILQNFLPAFEEADIITGYRADDAYFSFVRTFVRNEISIAQLKEAMKLGNLGEQFVLKSARSFEALKYLDCEPADFAEYSPRRERRNKEARAQYEKILEQQDWDGVFVRDILREEIKSGDPRIR